MYIPAALFVAGLAACGSDTTTADAGTTPTDAAAMGMDASATTGDATRGAALYVANACGSCHGADGKGSVAVPAAKSFASAEVQNKSDTAIGDVIRNGQGGGTMPAFGASLNAQQILDLVAFIRTVR